MLVHLRERGSTRYNYPFPSLRKPRLADFQSRKCKDEKKKEKKKRCERRSSTVDLLTGEVTYQKAHSARAAHKRTVTN